MVTMPVVLKSTAQHNKEITNFRKFWIPLNYMEYVYQDGSVWRRNFDICVNAAAYDTAGTLLADNIASVFPSTMVYFKDA